MKCLILAGGFGTRLYPLSITKAKPLMEYHGKPLLTHLMNKVPDGVNIFISCNRKFEVDFRNWQKGIRRQVELCVEDVWTEEQKKGPVNSLNFWVSGKNITEDLLVIAGDNYFEVALTQFIAAYDGHNTLVAVHDIGDRRQASQFGVVRLDGHRIAELEEKPADPKSSLIATACYIIPPRLFPLLNSYCTSSKKENLGSFISHLVTVDQVYGYLFAEPWFDIGSKLSQSASPRGSEPPGD